MIVIAFAQICHAPHANVAGLVRAEFYRLTEVGYRLIKGRLAQVDQAVLIYGCCVG